jgi:hypothetical protein
MTGIFLGKKEKLMKGYLIGKKKTKTENTHAKHTCIHTYIMKETKKNSMYVCMHAPIAYMHSTHHT